MKRVLAALRALWRREPVLIGTALPMLVGLGVLTAGQANLISSSVATVASVVSGLAIGFGTLRARAAVTSPATAAVNAARAKAALAAVRQAASDAAAATARLRSALPSKPPADPTPPTDPKPAA